jgi:hypothetical protein
MPLKLLLRTLLLLRLLLLPLLLLAHLGDPPHHNITNLRSVPAAAAVKCQQAYMLVGMTVQQQQQRHVAHQQRLDISLMLATSGSLSC